jgi:hypothetical protein
MVHSFSDFPNRALALVSGLFLSALTSAPTGAWAFPIRVGAEAAQVLMALDADLAAGSPGEFKFGCTSSQAGVCDLEAKALSETPIRQELITHPVDPSQYIAYRAVSGSAAFRAALYQATGRFSETRLFSDSVYERRVELEEGRFRMRCIRDESKPQSPFHHCWIIIGASLFVESPLVEE